MTLQEQNRIDAIKRDLECWKARALEAERKCEAWRVEAVTRAWTDYDEARA